MAKHVCNGAQLSCSFGSTPSTLTVDRFRRVSANGQPVATISDRAPDVNIPAFGTCTSPENPAVAVTGSAPCTPITPSPWTPGASRVTVGGIPALNDNSILMCQFGRISVTDPGQEFESIPSK